MQSLSLYLTKQRIDTAQALWGQIENTSMPADRWLGNFFHSERKRFGAQDRRFFAETLYSLFRHKTFYNIWSREILPVGDSRLTVLLASAREGMIPEDKVFEFARELRWGISPGILEKLKKMELPTRSSFEAGSLEEICAKYSFPAWLAGKWINEFGKEKALGLMAACQQRPPFTIRINPVKTTREALIQKFRNQNIPATETPQSPYGISFRDRANLFDSEEFRDGLFEIQDEGSQILCQKVDPKPGELIWDACAGGGGKTLLLAAMMQNKGRIVATDIRAKKLEELAKRAKRAGLFNIFPADLNRMSEISQAKKGFDKILVDAPCSGTGTLRRNPDAKWKLSEERIQGCRKDQLHILETVLPHLKKGGRLYYATCSLEPEENEEVMKEFLGKHPQLFRVPLPDGSGSLRLFPHTDQTDGFFLAIAENK